MEVISRRVVQVLERRRNGLEDVGAAGRVGDNIAGSLRFFTFVVVEFGGNWDIHRGDGLENVLHGQVAKLIGEHHSIAGDIHGDQATVTMLVETWDNCH